MRKESVTLSILNALMTSSDWLTTKQICDKVGCERKSVYSSVDALEISGFHVEVIKGQGGGFGSQNRYRFGGIFGYKRE